MSITYQSSIDAARLTVVESAMDDSGVGPANLNILTSSGGLIVSIPLGGPPTGTVSSNAINFNNLPVYNTAIRDGVPAYGRITDFLGNPVGIMTAGPAGIIPGPGPIVGSPYDITVYPGSIIQAGQIVALVTGQIVAQASS